MAHVRSSEIRRHGGVIHSSQHLAGRLLSSSSSTRPSIMHETSRAAPWARFMVLQLQPGPGDKIERWLAGANREHKNSNFILFSTGVRAAHVRLSQARRKASNSYWDAMQPTSSCTITKSCPALNSLSFFLSFFCFGLGYSSQNHRTWC